MRPWMLALLVFPALSTADEPERDVAVVQDRTELWGGRAVDAIHAEIGAHAAALEACHHGAARHRPARPTDLAVSFEVTTEGRPVSVVIEGGTHPSIEVRQCVTGRFGQMHFGAGPDGLARVVLEFSAQQMHGS